MKKRLYLLSLAVAAWMTLTGCEKTGVMTEPTGYSYYVWANDSGHEITLSLESLHNVPRFENILLKPVERYQEMETSTAFTPPPGGYYRSWKVTVLFDDGTYWAEYGYGVAPSEFYNADYDPTLPGNYDPEEVKNPEGCSGCPGKRWTYTFTDDDYEAAKKYGERTPAE